MQLFGLVSRIQYTDYQHIGLLDLRLSQRDQESNRTGSVRKINIHGRSRNYRRDGKSVKYQIFRMCVYVCVCVSARACVCLSP